MGGGGGGFNTFKEEICKYRLNVTKAIIFLCSILYLRLVDAETLN